MVMATDVLDVGGPAAQELVGRDAAALHERLVAHVRAVAGEEHSRSSVWGEHSYARARGPPSGAHVRVLLEARPPAAPAGPVDVLTPPAPAPAPPAADRDDARSDDARSGDEEDGAEEEDEDWEERLSALAPSAAHARLARAATDALCALRLERAAAAGALRRCERREGARHAARRLRRELAPHWGGAAAWVLNALPARLPPALRALFREAVRELRRVAPRLADRLPPAPPAPCADPLDAVPPPRDAAAPGPWLAWAPSGCDALDERFVRRLGALLHARRLAPAAPPPAAAAAPDRWCAALAQEARAALADVLRDAGERAVVLCGAGAGAALATWLAAGAAGGAGGVRALLLLAPPLLTAEGARDCPEDILEEVELPLLAVVGGGGAQCWRGAAAEVAARDAGGDGDGGEGAGGEPRAARRVLLLAGADDALRVPRRVRRRLRLPQQALDAAVAEECARWASDVTDPARAGALLAAPLAAPPRSARTSPGAEPRDERRGPGGAGGEEARSALGGNRAIEIVGKSKRAVQIVEGRVVSRVTGGSPLALPPPRRAEPRAEQRAEPRAEPALAAADIMQLPIVFADDEPALGAHDAGPAARAGSPAADASGAITVTSGHPRRVSAAGAIKYTRVIVAKRAPPPRAAAPAAAAAAAAPRRGPGRPPAARPAVLRRRALD